MDLKNNKITVGELLDYAPARAVFQRRPNGDAGTARRLCRALRTQKDHCGDSDRTQADIALRTTGGPPESPDAIGAPGSRPGGAGKETWPHPPDRKGLPGS